MPSLSWWSYCLCIRRCRKAPPCRRIDKVTKLQCEGTRRPSAALRQVVAKAGDDPSEVGLHSLRIGAATTLAAGGEVSQRVIQREGRWNSSESSKLYTRNNPEGAGIVSRKLAETGKIGQRQPGQGTVWGRTPWYRRDLGVGGCQWFATIGGLGRQRLRMLEPGQSAGGGNSRILAAR